MKLTLTTLAVLTALAVAPSALAETKVNWNAGIANEYVDHGVKMSAGDAPSLTLGARLSSGRAYAGVQGTTVDAGESDGSVTDIYAGYQWGVGSLSMDSGVNYKAISGGLGPDSFTQVYTSASHPLGRKAKIGGSLVYSPNEAGPNSSSLFGEVTGAYQVDKRLSFSGGYGMKSFDAMGAEDYTTYNLGATYRVSDRVGVDLRYHDNDLSESTYGDTAGDTVLVSLTANF